MRYLKEKSLKFSAREKKIISNTKGLKETKT
jgi:hypothetical protein